MIPRPTTQAPAARALAALLPVACAAALVGCGGGGDDAGSEAKTKVGDEVGVAAGTAKAYLFAEGVAASLAKGAPGRDAALAKAANASEFTVRALNAAQTAATKDPALAALASQLLNARASIGALTVVLRSGKTPPKSLLAGSLGTIQSVENASRDAGVTVKERVTTNLSGT